MNETSLKDLMDQAMTAGEPPLGADLLGGAVRGARRTRRRQVAGVIAAVAAITPAVIFGLPALTSALGSLPPGHGTGVVAPGHHRKGPRVSYRIRDYLSLATPGRVDFVHPKLPPAVHEADPVPITIQSMGQLLIDDMPPGARYRGVSGTLHEAGANHPDVVVLGQVRTAQGSGSVISELYKAASPDQNFSCSTIVFVNCTTYTLRGGVEVAEAVTTGQNTGGTMQMQQVSVFRPGMGVFYILEQSFGSSKSKTTPRLPLTLAQMVKAVLDPRWGLTISRSFVQQASGLHVVQAPAG
jgi:hypothetical protein